MASRLGPDPADDSFFSQEPLPVDPAISRPLREDSVEKDGDSYQTSPASSSQHSFHSRSMDHDRQHPEHANHVVNHGDRRLAPKVQLHIILYLCDGNMLT